MAASWIPTLALVAGIAVLAPILAECGGKLGVPSMVLELGLGIVVGPVLIFPIAGLQLLQRGDRTSRGELDLRG